MDNAENSENVDEQVKEIQRTFVELAEQLEKLINFVKENQGGEERH